MRDCEYYQELMSRLLDEGLSEEEEAALRAHVRTCPACLRMFSAFTGMTAALREDLAEPPEDLAPAVMARIAREADPAPRRRSSPRASRGPRPWVRLAAAACLVLIVAGAATAALRGRAKSSQQETASTRAADMAEPEAQAAGAADSAGDQPMTASVQGDEPVYDASQEEAAAQENGAAPLPAPSPSPSLEPLQVYDAARNHLGTIAPENIPAFQALITDEGWAEGSFEYMLRVEYQHRTYAFASDDEGGLVWWEEPSTQPLRSPGTFADLHALITTESPALPQ